MTVEEAVLQMNLLGHEFFMFSNAETRRKQMLFTGERTEIELIEPEFLVLDSSVNYIFDIKDVFYYNLKCRDFSFGI